MKRTPFSSKFVIFGLNMYEYETLEFETSLIYTFSIVWGLKLIILEKFLTHFFDYFGIVKRDHILTQYKGQTLVLYINTPFWPKFQYVLLNSLIF